MDKFADCTERGAQSATKLYNQEYVQGTRDEEIHFGVFSFIFLITVHPLHNIYVHHQCCHMQGE